MILEVDKELNIKVNLEGRKMINWNEILKDIISRTIMLVIGGAAGWFVGLFKGKKQSSMAIERKNEIYQPLLDDIKKYTTFDWSFLENVKVDILKQVVCDSYKFGLNEEIQDKCNYLYEVVQEYNSIKPVNVANQIIVDIFTEGYEKIYGSIIDGIAHHTDRDGNEWEEEVLVESVQIMRELNHSKEIESLLRNEGMYSGEVCVDDENGIYEPIYLELMRIYESALHVIVNGKPCKHSQPVIELDMSPEEYMAYYYDFFDRYNNDERIKKKYELREEIVYTSQSLVEDLKVLIDKIVRIYEIEEI